MTVAGCLFGCRPEPIAPAPDAVPTEDAPMPADTSGQAVPLEDPADTQAVAPADPQDLPPAALIDPGESQPAPLEETTSEEPPSISLPTRTTPRPAPTDSGSPQRRTAFYRLDANVPAAIPDVVLSKGHEALCRVKVGDTMPNIELPELGGEPQKLSNLFGERATVVVFWKSDRYMARQQLVDLGPDVVEPFGISGFAVVGIAVNEPGEQAQRVLHQAGAQFSNLLDANGEAFAKVGSEKLPRTYLVDPQGKILWFDIEYSHATRRELHQALRAVTGEPAAGEPASAGGTDPAPQ